MEPIHKIPRHIDKERERLRKLALQRRLRKIAYFVGAAIVLWFIFGGDLGVISMLRAMHQKKMLERAVQLERRRAEILSAQIQKLSQDTFYIEQIARTRYGMARKNEIVFVFPSDSGRKSIVAGR